MRLFLPILSIYQVASAWRSAAPPKLFTSSRSTARLAFQHAASPSCLHNSIRRASILSQTTTSLRSSAAASSDAEGTSSKSIIKKPIPIILLAGFLGSGKTSTLKHLLENNQNIKIGTIVNDVASVNIDAKLIANSDSRNDDNSINAFAEGVVELQNGCACCSLADELFASVERLTEGGKRELDAIVVELSGVADPVAVRDNWEQAKIAGHPATKLADLKRTVTLIDSCTFGTDWMTWDTAGDRDRWTEEGDDCAAVRKVPELLAEQVEAADLLLVNKIDLAGEKQTKVASGVARGLNKDATVVEVEFGRVAVKELLGKLSILDFEGEEAHSEGHSHAHEHAEHEGEATTCTKVDCTDESHSHSHSHATEATSCDNPNCNDTSHSHSHEHSSESGTSFNALAVMSNLSKF